MFETVTEIRKILKEQAEAVDKANAATINAAVYQARLAVIAEEKKVFDRPKPFSTDRAWVFTNAKAEGDRMSGELRAKDKQAQYLSFEIDGGTRKNADPGATKYDVPVGADAEDTDQFGGIAFGTSKKFSRMYKKEKKARAAAAAATRRSTARAAVAAGLTDVAKRKALRALKKWEWVVKSQNAPGILFGVVDGVRGYFMRPERTLVDPERHLGVQSVHNIGKPKLLMRFADQSRYKPIFHYDEIIAKVASKYLSSEAFGKEMERIDAEHAATKTTKTSHSGHGEEYFVACTPPTESSLQHSIPGEDIMLQTSLNIAASTADRLKAGKVAGIRPDLAANRLLAERIVNKDTWAIGMGPAPILVCGGLLYPQRLRPTQDAHIKAVRSYSNGEIQRGIGIIADHLERYEGIRLTSLSRDAREIDVGYGDQVRRYEVEARLGGDRGMRMQTQIDISVLRGPDAMPKGVVERAFPASYKNGDPLVCYAQPLEAALAEQWLAVLLQNDTDFRLKHHADILLLRTANLDLERVADETFRLCRHRGIATSLLVPEPEALEWGNWERRENDWDRLLEQRRLPTLERAFLDVGADWSELHAQLQANIIRDVGFGIGGTDRLDALLAEAEPVEPAPVLAYRPRGF